VASKNCFKSLLRPLYQVGNRTPSFSSHSTSRTCEKQAGKVRWIFQNRAQPPSANTVRFLVSQSKIGEVGRANHHESFFKGSAPFLNGASNASPPLDGLADVRYLGVALTARSRALRASSGETTTILPGLETLSAVAGLTLDGFTIDTGRRILRRVILTIGSASLSAGPLSASASQPVPAQMILRSCLQNRQQRYRLYSRNQRHLSLCMTAFHAAFSMLVGGLHEKASPKQPALPSLYVSSE